MAVARLVASAEVAPVGMHFLFLQGMPSPFFSEVAEGLSRLGHRCTGVVLCPGDAVFWRSQSTLRFRGRASDWPAYIQKVMTGLQVTDLVLLGERRRYHEQAVTIARKLGVRVSVTDFGYLRPDWITLERNGMSGDSLFPRDPDAIRAIACSATVPDLRPRFHDSLARMSVNDVVYSFANVLFAWTYPHYRSSYNRPHPLVYFPARGLQMLRARHHARVAERRLSQLKGSGVRYFVFPLQLEHDFQITAYSPFAGIGDAIAVVLESFARCASNQTRLVIKVHPADPGLTNWEKLTSRIARAHGISDRIVFLPGGNLDDVIEGCDGMVTVNSTSGIQALKQTKPVVALGKAVYDVVGLTQQDGIDSFWRNPTTPDAGLVGDFVTALTATVQIRGAFFNEQGRACAVSAAVRRLGSATVGQPVREST